MIQPTFPVRAINLIIKVRRSRAAVAAVGSVLFAVGGYDGSTDLATGENSHPRFN